VDVLRREAEHVIVEPMTAHRLAPVAGDLRDAAAAIGTPGAAIGGVPIDGVAPREHDGPVVVVELTGEEVGAGEAVILGAVVPVVLVGRDGVPAEAAVLRYVGRQTIVMAEEDRLSVAPDRQLRRERPVEGPQRLWPLRREIRVKAGTEGDVSIDPRVQIRRNARIVSGVLPGSLLRDFNRDPRWKQIEPLVRPNGARRTTFDRPEPATERRVDRSLRLIGLYRRKWIQRRDRVSRQHIETRHRLRERLHAKQRARRRAGRYAVTKRAADERTEAANGSQEAPGGEQSPFHQVPTRDLALGMGAH